MAKPMSEYFKTIAAQIEADERADREAEAQEKLDKLEARALSDDDADVLAWVRKFRAELEKEDEDEEAEAKKEAEKKEPKPKPEPKPAEEEPQGKKRPGRKNGQAYGWWVDDEGKVFKLETGGARIWTEPDEDDEVEVPEPAPEPEPEPKAKEA